MKTALLAGVTGLIGKQVLQILLADDYYSRVIALTRKPLDFQHPKIENIITDFNDLTNLGEELQADDVFCCLGTTMKQAGTKAAFRKVDFDFPVQIGWIAKALGANQYLLVSALGANKNSAIYYNQVKGEVEESIVNIGFKSVHIFRPSLLLGMRKESRPGEDAAKLFYSVLGRLIPAKYRAIDAAKVARAMVVFAKEQRLGIFIHESQALQQI
jgi:uncharacterized protein YbjT (DUF2867 family)